MTAHLPHITRACFEITLDNGGLNRLRPEAAVRKEMERFLTLRPYYDQLPEIDRWLGALSPEDFETVCIGEHTEAASVLRDAPPFTDELLSDYFDEVC